MTGLSAKDVQAIEADDDTMSDIDAITDVLAADEARRQRFAESAPSGFDPAAVFLLRLGFENMFDPTGQEHVFRCKGCRRDVRRGERQQHHRRHVRAAANATTGGDMTKTTTRTRNNSKAKDTAPAVDAKSLMSELFKRATSSIKGVIVKANPKVGYTALRMKDDDTVLAFLWPMKSGVRVEAAVTAKDIADAKLRKAISPSLRSSRLVSQTKVESESDFDVALAMLTRAAELTAEQRAAKAAKGDGKASTSKAKTGSTRSATGTDVKPDPKPSTRKGGSKTKSASTRSRKSTADVVAEETVAVDTADSDAEFDAAAPAPAAA